jgi:hypothetical protein
MSRYVTQSEYDEWLANVREHQKEISKGWAILQTFEPSELSFEQWEKYMAFFDSAIAKLTASIENPPIVAHPLELDGDGRRMFPVSYSGKTIIDSFGNVDKYRNRSDRKIICGEFFNE